LEALLPETEAGLNHRPPLDTLEELPEAYSTPFLPPPVQRRLQDPPAKSNFLAAVMPSSQKKWPLPEGAAIFERLFV
jgi:hypothetical protein